MEIGCDTVTYPTICLSSKPCRRGKLSYCGDQTRFSPAKLLLLLMIKYYDKIKSNLFSFFLNQVLIHVKFADKYLIVPTSITGRSIGADRTCAVLINTLWMCFYSRHLY